MKRNGNHKEPPVKGLRSVQLAEKGIHSDKDFVLLMNAIQAEVLSGRLNHNVANSSINAGRQMLRLMELRYKYGVQRKTNDSSDVLHLLA